MAYPLYAMILALSTAGIPVAISKLVAEKLAENKPEQAGAVFRVASRSLVISGLLFTVLTVVMARVFVVAGLLRDPRAFWPLIATAPAVLLVALSLIHICLRKWFLCWKWLGSKPWPERLELPA